MMIMIIMKFHTQQIPYIVKFTSLHNCKILSLQDDDDNCYRQNDVVVTASPRAQSTP